MIAERNYQNLQEEVEALRRKNEALSTQLKNASAEIQDLQAEHETDK